MGNIQTKRIYTIEFLRLIFIAGIAAHHIIGSFCPQLRDAIFGLFHTTTHRFAFGVDGFFIIGGFFLYRRTVLHNLPIFENIKRLWLRLVPAILCAFGILCGIGLVGFWRIIGLVTFLPGTGLAPEVIKSSEWFICVYFWISCLIMGLFSCSEKSAWIILALLTYVALSLQIHAAPLHYAGRIDQIYYTIVSTGFCRGVICMSLGMIASFVSGKIHVGKKGVSRLIATCIEVFCVFTLLSYVFCPSVAGVNTLDAELITALFMISAAHGWGYITGFLNRQSWIQFVSRYTYSFLIGHAVMLRIVSAGALPRNCCSAIYAVGGGGIIIAIIEFHLVEKLIVPKLQTYLN